MSYQSEAELEQKLVSQLVTQGYERVVLKDYEALVDNFRKQLNVINSDVLEKELSDTEFKRVLNTVDSKTVYASAKQLRDKFDLQLDNGKDIYLSLLAIPSLETIEMTTESTSIYGGWSKQRLVQYEGNRGLNMQLKLTAVSRIENDKETLAMIRYGDR